MNQTKLTNLLGLAREVDTFQFCSPSDDPDEQTNVVYGFKHLAKKFIGLASRVQNRELQIMLKQIDTNIENNILQVYDLHADIQPLIDYIREITETSIEWSEILDEFIDSSIIEQLNQIKNSKFDLTKVIRFCEELNNSFSVGNYLASTLLLRAIINHVPPIFGHTTFSQVVSQASKSRKELFKLLEESARPVADLHTHDIIRHKEILPTKNQLEPFKPSLEFLLQEIVIELQK